MNPHFATSGKPTIQSRRKSGLHISLTIVCLIMLTPCSSAFAGGIYKSVDRDGNVIFTDQPTQDAETIRGRPADKRDELSDSAQPTSGEELDADADDDHRELPPSETVLVAPEPVNPPKTETNDFDEPAVFLPVTRVEILTPQHDSFLLDPLGQVWVEVQSYPTPISKSGLTAQLWMDGELVTSQKSPLLRLPPPPRGTHVLRVKMVDGNGRLVRESNTVHIHVKYQFAEQ